LKAFRRNGQAWAKAGAEQEFFDFGVDGEGADERNGVANRHHTHRVRIFGRIERARLRHERREDPGITKVK
jgi:hypothetical protein